MTPTREPEEAVDLAHPLGVARGEVVVDGDDVHAAAGQRVQVGRQGRDERLAFAGLHLGDLALVEHHAADELDVVVALAERALGRLAHRRERLGQQRVERLALSRGAAGTRPSWRASCASESFTQAGSSRSRARRAERSA